MARIFRSHSALTLTVVVLALNGCGGSSFYYIGGTVSGLVGSRLALQNNGSPIAVEPTADGFQLLATYLSNGAAYDITVTTQPTTPSQTCVVANGKGTIAGANVMDVKVTCTTKPARFLLGEGGNFCFTTSAIDSTSGALTAASGSPTCFPNGLPDSQGNFYGFPGVPMVVDPQGRFLYMAVYQGFFGLRPIFAIDRSSGALTLVSADGGGPLGLDNLVIDPSGRFLFAIGTHGGVDTLTVDSASGALTYGSSYCLPTSGCVNEGSFPEAASVDPLDRYVYVEYAEFFFAPSSFQTKNWLIALSMDSKSGALSQVAAPVDIGAAPSNVWLAPDPSGKYLYVGPVGSNGIAAYGIDPADGTLTPVSGSPFAAGNGPGAAAVDPYGKDLYVTNSNSNDISAYAIDSESGVLTPIEGSPFPTGSAPSSIAVEPLGHFVYVGDALGVSAYKIDALSGALTPISGSPFTFAYGALISY
jgi:6-phosphogluconolactonase